VDLEQRLREQPLRVRDVWSEDKAARLPARVMQLRRRRSLLGAAMVLGTAVAALLLVRGALDARDAQAAREQRPSVRVPAAQQVVVLHDGSRAEPADADSRLQVVSDRPGDVGVRIERGGARFEVVPNPRRSFVVESGPVRVRVIGTVFSITRTSTGAAIAVEHGLVQVSWAGKQLQLGMGESGVFPPPAELMAAQSPPQTAPSSAGWRDLAKRGKYHDAYSALRRGRAHVHKEPQDLMLAADVARLSGHPEQAVPHLRAVLQRFPGDPRAPVASFTLGRVLLHDLRQPRQAAAAFHRARTLWPAGPLALDAWASEAEALHAAGERARAAALAARYLDLHPEARHAAAMRRLGTAR